MRCSVRRNTSCLNSIQWLCAVWGPGDDAHEEYRRSGGNTMSTPRHVWAGRPRLRDRRTDGQQAGAGGGAVNASGRRSRGKVIAAVAAIAMSAVTFGGGHGSAGRRPRITAKTPTGSVIVFGCSDPAAAAQAAGGHVTSQLSIIHGVAADLPAGADVDRLHRGRQPRDARERPPREPAHVGEAALDAVVRPGRDGAPDPRAHEAVPGRPRDHGGRRRHRRGRLPRPVGAGHPRGRDRHQPQQQPRQTTATGRSSPA